MEQLPLISRVAIILVAIAFGLVLLLIPGEGQAPAPPSPYDKHLLELDRAALDKAYQAQIGHLFEVWMRDSAGQPERAGKGVQQARRAYIESMKALDARAKALEGR